ncbi:hypothetical protein BDW71DRAFT_20177 [Aspergillus fruticulosus]
MNAACASNMKTSISRRRYGNVPHRHLHRREGQPAKLTPWNASATRTQSSIWGETTSPSKNTSLRFDDCTLHFQQLLQIWRMAICRGRISFVLHLLRSSMSTAGAVRQRKAECELNGPFSTSNFQRLPLHLPVNKRKMSCQPLDYNPCTRREPNTRKVARSRRHLPMSLSPEVEVTAGDGRGTVASLPLHLGAMSPGVVVGFIDLLEVAIVRRIGRSLQPVCVTGLGACD